MVRWAQAHIRAQAILLQPNGLTTRSISACLFLLFFQDAAGCLVFWRGFLCLNATEQPVTVARQAVCCAACNFPTHSCCLAAHQQVHGILVGLQNDSRAGRPGKHQGVLLLSLLPDMVKLHNNCSQQSHNSSRRRQCLGTQASAIRTLCAQAICLSASGALHACPDRAGCCWGLTAGGPPGTAAGAEPCCSGPVPTAAWLPLCARKHQQPAAVPQPPGLPCTIPTAMSSRAESPQADPAPFCLV